MKNLVVALDYGRIPEWIVQAKNRQIADWVEANKKALPFDNLIILPSVGESRLYWLEGKVGDITDATILAEMRDKLKPVLEIALGITLDTKGYISPEKKAINELQAHRKRLSTR
jgi:hypothetical protein